MFRRMFGKNKDTGEHEQLMKKTKFRLLICFDHHSVTEYVTEKLLDQFKLIQQKSGYTFEPTNENACNLLEDFRHKISVQYDKGKELLEVEVNTENKEELKIHRDIVRCVFFQLRLKDLEFT